MRKKIIFILLVILFILVFLLVIFNKVKSEDNEDFFSSEYRYSMKPDEEVEHLDEDAITADDSGKFFTYYYSKIDAKDIQENWDNFFRIVIPKYCKKISENNVEEYYKENKNEILVETGINNEEDFENLIKKITFNFSTKLQKIKSLTILDDAVYDEKTNKTLTRLKAVYDNEEVIFNIKVYDKKSADNVFIEYE